MTNSLWPVSILEPQLELAADRDRIVSGRTGLVVQTRQSRSAVGEIVNIERDFGMIPVGAVRPEKPVHAGAGLLEEVPAAGLKSVVEVGDVAAQKALTYLHRLKMKR